MKGDSESFALLEVFLLIAAISLLVMALPAILRAIGMHDLGDLTDKMQNIQKRYGESFTMSLPKYVESVQFFRGKIPAKNARTPHAKAYAQTRTASRSRAIRSSS